MSYKLSEDERGFFSPELEQRAPRAAVRNSYHIQLLSRLLREGGCGGMGSSAGWHDAVLMSLSSSFPFLLPFFFPPYGLAVLIWKYSKF